MAVDGFCDPAFTRVRDIFEASFADGLNTGAAVAASVDGRVVVDLWGGIADPRTGRAWERDTPCPCFSCTKAVTTTAALLVMDSHGLSLDQPVTSWWPEYGANGKQDTTTEDLFTHRAGLPAFDRPISAAEAADPAAMADQLAGQKPEWEPGAKHGYHALTFGWLVGEIVRRHTGTGVGEFVRRHIGADLAIGATPDEINRAARLALTPADRSAWSGSPTIEPSVIRALANAYQDPTSLLMRSSGNPVAAYNRPEVLAGGWPAAGLVTTARALADFYDRLLRGEILPDAVLRDAIRERVRGADETLFLESAFGLGYMLPCQNCEVPEPARRGAFGHPGAGGSEGLADVENRVAFAFIPNLRQEALAGDRRAYSLLEAVYEAL
ncbi:beta-lactamase family protein [Skermania sp. ID1734]|uniref:serine hydrolase domain-containing protein n=1 Tax=Skermania sp. ID1734 TaxID=2597516 RepID=UPI00117EF287|nr:serine hydrolase domain-containing protein [Skermania sp. ID1734]TSD98192.1 beta-lactamase family protein [Skermania sp. ID1734]